MTGRCFTNLDGYQCERWPIAFCAVPSKGERVRAESGKTLAVVGVTHAADDSGWPYIIVELHL